MCSLACASLHNRNDYITKDLKTEQGDFEVSPKQKTTAAQRATVIFLARSTEKDIRLFHIINIIFHDFHLIFFQSIQDVYKAIFSAAVW